MITALVRLLGLTLCAIGMGSQALAQELLKRRRARSSAHFRAGFNR